jgi:hypothetical protein
MAQINIKDAITNIVKKYLISFSRSVLDRFYTKEQLSDIYSKKEIIKNLSENDSNKLIYNRNVLCTEDELTVRFYNKEELDDIYNKKDVINSFSKNGNNQLIYNGNILCTEDNLISRFYNKEQLIDIYNKKEVLNSLSKNDNDKLLYNGSILCTEDELINIKVKASSITVETDNGEKTLQDILTSILKQYDIPKAYCGSAECGESYCGDTDSDDA